MTKLSGTSGQSFRVSPKASTCGASRSGKAPGAKSPDNSSFNDLLHTVSNLAKRALNDEGGDTSAKAGSLRTRLAESPTVEGRDGARTHRGDDEPELHSQIVRREN